MGIMFVYMYTLLNVVSRYNVSVLSMMVLNKSLDREVGA